MMNTELSMQLLFARKGSQCPTSNSKLMRQIFELRGVPVKQKFCIVLFTLLISASLSACSMDNSDPASDGNQIADTSAGSSADGASVPAENVDTNGSVDSDPAQTEVNQASYYGKWTAQKVLAYGIGTYSNDEAGKMIGKSLTLSEEEAGVLTDQLSDDVKVIHSPEYQERTISEEDFQADYRMSFDALGISANSAVEVHVTGSDGGGGVFLVKDSSTIVMIAGGTFFEITKQ